MYSIKIGDEIVIFDERSGDLISDPGSIVAIELVATADALHSVALGPPVGPNEKGPHAKHPWSMLHVAETLFSGPDGVGVRPVAGFPDLEELPENVIV